MHSEEEKQQYAPLTSQFDLKSILMMVLAIMVLVYILQVSYNSVIPNITKSGSLKLGKINWYQALSLMVLAGFLFK